MKKMIGLLAAATLASSAQAAVLSYDFTAIVDSVTESDSSQNYLSTSVNSSTLAGLPVSIGQVVHGHFSYDTETPINDGYQPPAPTQGSYILYSGPFAQNSFSAAFANGPAINSVPGTSNLLQVVNNASDFGGADGFSISTNVFKQQALETGSVFLDDLSGTAFNHGGVPAALNFADFGYSTFSYGYVNLSQGPLILSVNARLDTLTPAAAVPEPSTYAMLAAGLLLLAWRRKMQRRSR